MNLKFQFKKSETVRERAKQTTFWDHKHCQLYRQNIFEHFKNSKKNIKISKSLKKHKFALISEKVGDRVKQTEIWHHNLKFSNL